MTYETQIASVVAALPSRDYVELETKDQLNAMVIKNRMRCPLAAYTQEKLKQVLEDVSDIRLYNWFLKTDPRIIARALRLA